MCSRQSRSGNDGRSPESGAPPPSSCQMCSRSPDTWTRRSSTGGGRARPSAAPPPSSSPGSGSLGLEGALTGSLPGSQSQYSICLASCSPPWRRRPAGEGPPAPSRRPAERGYDVISSTPQPETGAASCWTQAPLSMSFHTQSQLLTGLVVHRVTLTQVQSNPTGPVPKSRAAGSSASCPTESQ